MLFFKLLLQVPDETKKSEALKSLTIRYKKSTETLFYNISQSVTNTHYTLPELTGWSLYDVFIELSTTQGPLRSPVSSVLVLGEG